MHKIWKKSVPIIHWNKKWNSTQNIDHDLTPLTKQRKTKLGLKVFKNYSKGFKL